MFRDTKFQKIFLLDEKLFPEYVQKPIADWFRLCDLSKTNVDIYTDKFLTEFEQSSFFYSCKKSVEGKFIWNDWGNCDVSCGGGIRLKTAKSCVPSYSYCFGIQIIEESCNSEVCPDADQIYSAIPPGTIISWVPKINQNSPDRYPLTDTSWVVCNGIETCKEGIWAGQSCDDLSDRTLVGFGKTGQILELKDASLPDHAHKHRHTGTASHKVTYRTGPKTLKTLMGYWAENGRPSDRHNHDEYVTTSFNVDYSKMNDSEAFISKITNPKISVSTAANELYSPHLRVVFMFKCY